MNKRGAWGPMADRVRPGEHRADSATPAAGPEPTGPPGLKHCWVQGPDGAVPGLLLGWRRERDGTWLGRVVRPVRDDRGWLVMEDWLPADRLAPANRDQARRRS
jgi:hypothetical protein